MKPRRSWTAKSKMDMIVLNLNQQLDALKKYYPNFVKSTAMLKMTIDSFKEVDGPTNPFTRIG
jgi:hypothetical protein